MQDGKGKVTNSPQGPLMNDDKQNGKETVREKPKEPLMLRILKEAWPYAAVIAGVVLLNSFILVNARIPSGSMEKTIMTGDRLFGNRLAYKNADPARYDIVIFRYPDDPKRLFVKRVIGLPGETVMIVNGKVYIDGSDEPLTDSFCPEKPTGTFGPYTVPEGCYFMLGDNRENSNDARFWRNTYVKKNAIIGKAGFRYWPFTRFGPVKSTMDDTKNW